MEDEFSEAVKIEIIIIRPEFKVINGAEINEEERGEAAALKKERYDQEQERLKELREQEEEERKRRLEEEGE